MEFDRDKLKSEDRRFLMSSSLSIASINASNELLKNKKIVIAIE